jgi:hypothetical protein
MRVGLSLRESSGRSEFEIFNFHSRVYPSSNACAGENDS